MRVRKTDSSVGNKSGSNSGNCPTTIITQESVPPSEGSNAKRKPGNSDPSVVKNKPGRKRKGRNMAGRYPFLAWANKYLEAVGNNYSENTRKEHARRYRRMNKEMTMLVEKGKMVTLNPEKMTAKEVLDFMGYLRTKGVKETERCHDLSALKNLLAFIGNPAVEQFKMRYKTMVPKRRQGRYPPMKGTDLDLIVKASENVRDDDWRMLQAYSVVLLSMSAGLRNKELRLSDVGDLDTEEWMFHARRVKGEATYGQARDVPIRPEAHRILTRYLKLREEKVAHICPNNNALFPALRDKEDGYYASNSLQKLKTLVEKDTGIKFDLRKCRRTFGQLALDEDLSIESVSVLMGHSTTKTTENNYCRRKQDLAIREAQMIWNGKKPSGSQPVAKTPQIESKFEVSGYA